MTIRPLSKKLVLALAAVLDIAYHGGAEPVRSKEISARQGIPRRYLEQVMQELVRTGVLRGMRGPRGGYRLARERRRIRLGDIARVVIDVEQPNDPTEALCGSVLCEEVLKPVCDELAEGVMTRLDALTLEDLCRRAREGAARAAVDARLDFTI